MGQSLAKARSKSLSVDTGLDAIRSSDDVVLKRTQISAINLSKVDNGFDTLLKPPKTNKRLIEGMNKQKDGRRASLNALSSNGLLISTFKLHPKNSTIKPEKYVIFSHGNTTDMYSIRNYMQYLADKFNVIVIGYDYPGFGLSDGKPNEKGCIQSLDIVINYVKDIYLEGDDNANKKIILIGQSFGSSVLIDYALENNWTEPIILISPYKNIVKPFYDTKILNSFVKNYKSDLYDKISKLKCPVKIFHGTKDRLIRISHIEKLFDSLSDKSLRPVWVDDADNNTILTKIDSNDLREVFSL